MNTRQVEFNEYLMKLQDIQGISDFYDYEEQFAKSHTEFGKQMVELNIAQQQQVMAKKEGYKKSFNKIWVFSIATAHSFSHSSNGFKVSPYLQNLILATSAESPYRISRELLLLNLNVDITKMQLCSITGYYGQALFAVSDQNKCLHPLENETDFLYAMADGSMILTREEQWKEAKSGRLFSDKAYLQTDGKANQINTSQ